MGSNISGPSILKRRLTVYELIISNFRSVPLRDMKSQVRTLSERFLLGRDLIQCRRRRPLPSFTAADLWSTFSLLAFAACRNLHSLPSLSFRKNSRRAASMLQSAPLYASRIGGRTDGSTNSRRSDYFDVWISPRTIRHAAQFAVGIEAKLAIIA